MLIFTSAVDSDSTLANSFKKYEFKYVYSKDMQLVYN